MKKDEFNVKNVNTSKKRPFVSPTIEIIYLEKVSFEIEKDGHEIPSSNTKDANSI